MSKIVDIPCKTCKKKFTPKSPKNIFCCRSCFKIDFYRRKKLEELNNPKFPFFSCPKCNQKIQLDFDPSKEGALWLSFRCPGCNVLMISVSEDILTYDLPI
jgi:hypothetical protein